MTKGIPGRALRACAGDGVAVLTSISHLFLSQCTVPTCYKTITIAPLPKKNPSELLPE